MKPKIIAHRGASAVAPENTLPAFQLACEMGADAIETDVHLTKDGIPVLMHDETVNRTTNGKGLIQQHTLAELQALDAGVWFSSSYKGTGILTLDALLDWAKDKQLALNIELKNNKIDYPHLEEIVYTYVKEANLLHRVIFSTFNAESVKRLTRYKNETEIAFLTSRRGRNLPQLAQELGVQGLHIKHTLLRPGVVAACHTENIAVRVYTVNKETQMLRCFQEACDAIITDKPDTAVHCLDAFQTIKNK